MILRRIDATVFTTCSRRPLVSRMERSGVGDILCLTGGGGGSTSTDGGGSVGGGGNNHKVLAVGTVFKTSFTFLCLSSSILPY